MRHIVIVLPAERHRPLRAVITELAVLVAGAVAVCGALFVAYGLGA